MKKSVITLLFLLGMLILLASAVCSCSRVQYVPVETVRTDSVYMNKTVRDSVYVMDSVLVVKGDTVTEYRWRYIYKHSDKTDTVYVNRTDSVRVPYPVEKRLSKWQQFKMDVGGYAVVTAIVLVFAIVGYSLYRIRKR